MTCGRVGAPDGPGPVLIGADLRGASEARARVPAAAAGRSVLARLPSTLGARAHSRERTCEVSFSCRRLGPLLWNSAFEDLRDFLHD